jgi:hypothetical protein
MKMQEKVIFRSSQGANEEEKKTHSIDIPGCIRRLSTSERVGLWSLAADVAVAARIVGDIEEKNLLHAIMPSDKCILW